MASLLGCGDEHARPSSIDPRPHTEMPELCSQFVCSDIHMLRSIKCRMFVWCLVHVSQVWNGNPHAVPLQLANLLGYFDRYHDQAKPLHQRTAPSKDDAFSYIRMMPQIRRPWIIPELTNIISIPHASQPASQYSAQLLLSYCVRMFAPSRLMSSQGSLNSQPTGGHEVSIKSGGAASSGFLQVGK